MASYSFVLSTSFPSGINEAVLSASLLSTFPTIFSYVGVDYGAGIAYAYFTQTLTSGQQTTLNNIVAAHNPAANPNVIILPGATYGTTVTIQATQTANRTITLPDATTTLVGTNVSQTLTNKTIDATSNTILNITDASIATNAGINANKIADGSVSNTVFEYLGGVTSNIQTQLNSKVDLTSAQTVTNKTFIDASTTFQDDIDSTKKMQFQLSGITTATTRTLTVPDATTTLVGTTVAQTLTNKTIIDNGSNVAANSLKTTGATIDVSSAVPPSAGQVLTATDSTHAIWQTNFSRATYSFPYDVIANTSAFTTFANFSYINARYGSYTSVQLYFYATASSTKPLIVQVANLTASNIVGTSATITTNGFNTVPLTTNFPIVADALWAIQVQRTLNGAGNNPEIFGLQLEFN